jgi:hypothetical protein
MSKLIDRLKVTTAKQIQPAVAQVKVPPSIKIMGPTAIKVAPMVEPSAGGKPIQIDTARTNAFIEASLRCKLAECKPKVDIGINDAIIAQYRAEYQEFLKQLDTMDFKSMIFGNTAEATETPTDVAPLDQEEVPLANGISVGEDAGGSAVIPTANQPKKSRKKRIALEKSVAEDTSNSTDVVIIDSTDK